MNQVKISLCIPQEYVRIVQVSLSSPVSELQRFWPNSPKHFIFKGAMLLETLTFALCGVQHGDSIIALPQTTSSESGVVQAWMSASRDVEGLNYLIGSLVNPATMQEAARLRDLRLTALESRPRAYRTFCRHFLQECPIETQSHKTVVSSERPIAPSTAALPAPWNQPRPFGPRKY
jgi:predicted metal-binding transcription factor (methanogenesis marker protein 9)